MRHVTLELAPPLARLVLDRPPLNVIDLGAATELVEALERVGGHADVSVLHVSAHGKAFCAGVDVRDHLPDRGAEMLSAFDHACRLLLELPPITVASVHGAALGGGLELVLCCDFACASSEASFGQPEIKLGVFPPVAAVTLPRRVGWRLANDLILTGRTLTAAEGMDAGLLNAVFAPDRLAEGTQSLIDRLLAHSPASLRLAKRALELSRARPTAGEIEAAERLYVDELMNSPDAIEGLEAFLEKRSPVWGAQPKRTGR